MRQCASLLLILVVNFALAANEEKFTWSGIQFCETSVGDVLEQFPNATYFGDVGIIRADHLGQTLGGHFEELFFYVRADGIVIGVHIPIISGDFNEIENRIDDLAVKRWGDEFTKDNRKHGEDSHDYLNWWGNDDGADIGMHLHSSETSPLFKLGQSEDGNRPISIGLKGSTGCDRAKSTQSD